VRGKKHVPGLPAGRGLVALPLPVKAIAIASHAPCTSGGPTRQSESEAHICTARTATSTHSLSPPLSLFSL
jgi:hypothetical protein